MTQLQIINLALGHLGMTAITQAQLTASVVPSAVSANLYWEPCRDEVLGESRWPFATTTLSLASLDRDDSVWEYCYTVPTLSVGTIWNVFNSGTIDRKEEEDFEVKYVPTLSVAAVFTDLDEAIAEYTYKVTDPALWNTKFVMAFSYRLAASMSMGLSADASKGATLMELYNGIISEAKRLSGSEKRKVPIQSSGYVDAR